MDSSRLRTELWLIFTSLLIAFGIWLIAKQGELDTTWLNVPVQVQNVPEHMIIDTTVPQVSINVQFPLDRRNRVVERNFSLPIDVTEIFDADPRTWSDPTLAMEVDYAVELHDIDKRIPDQSVQVIGLQPRAVPLRAEFRTQEAEVEVPTVGELAASLELLAPPRPDPARLRVTGSPEALSALAERDYKLPTEPLDLSTVRSSGQIFPMLQVPAGLMLLHEDELRITVDIAVVEREVRQVVSGVPVVLVALTPGLVTRVEPELIDVVVEGPPSALDSISPEDFTVVPTRLIDELEGETQKVGVEARLRPSVPVEAAGLLRIIETRPSRIDVTFEPAAEAPGTTSGLSTQIP